MEQLVEKENEFQQRLANDREERQSATETEKLKALKLEASKWKQAMKEAEKRVELEVKQAKEQGREEREAELMPEFSETKQRCDIIAGGNYHCDFPTKMLPFDLSSTHLIDRSFTLY